MSERKSRLQEECERMVAAEAVMRLRVTRLEELFPQAARQTAEVRHAMIDFLACVNNIQVTIAAKRQTGDEPELVRQEPAEETPLFAAAGGHADHALASAATEGSGWRDSGTDHAFASAATGPQRTLMPAELMRMEASLHRAGDHSLDADAEIEVGSPEINVRNVANVYSEQEGGPADAGV